VRRGRKRMGAPVGNKEKKYALTVWEEKGLALMNPAGGIAALSTSDSTNVEKFRESNIQGRVIIY
jgi:hypothetical protein